MNKSEKLKSLLSSFFRKVTPEQLEEAQAVSGLGYLPRGTLVRLLDDEQYGIEDLVTLLFAENLVRQEEMQVKDERIAELESICSQQQRAIDQIADQGMKLRALLSRIDPDREAISSFDLLKNAAKSVESGDGRRDDL